MEFILYIYLVLFIIVLVNELYTLIYNKQDNYVWNYIHNVGLNEEIAPSEKQKLIYRVIKDNYGTIGVLFPGIYFLWMVVGLFTTMGIFHIIVLGLNLILQRINNYVINKNGKFPAPLHFLNKILFSIIYIIVGLYFIDKIYGCWNLPVISF